MSFGDSINHGPPPAEDESYSNGPFESIFILLSPDLLKDLNSNSTTGLTYSKTVYGVTSNQKIEIPGSLSLKSTNHGANNIILEVKYVSGLNSIVFSTNIYLTSKDIKKMISDYKGDSEITDRFSKDLVDTENIKFFNKIFGLDISYTSGYTMLMIGEL